MRSVWSTSPRTARVEEQEPTTQELRAVQRQKESDERDAARDASTDADERTHERRADKASYLEEKLAQQQQSEEHG
jgi:hypothetical protein